jgi:uncharacterized phage-associated protein
MNMRFGFNLEKAYQAMAYMLERIGTIEKVKLTKLVYLADRQHFIERGYPITGDDQYAMKKGPVPSLTLDVLDGDFPAVFDFIHIDDNLISLKKSPGTTALNDDERATLDQIVARDGHKDKWVLVRETHKLPEYEQTYKEGTSTRIPYELIAKVSGNENRFRKNRPVISQEAAAHMSCPFPSGSDL